MAIRVMMRIIFLWPLGWVDLRLNVGMICSNGEAAEAAFWVAYLVYP